MLVLGELVVLILEINLDTAAGSLELAIVAVW